MSKQKYSPMALIGLGVLGMMAYTFIAPKLLSKPKVDVPVVAPVAEVPVPSGTVQAQLVPPVTVGIPTNADVPAAMDDLNMNFAGVTFAENIPGLSYGFPMAGIV